MKIRLGFMEGKSETLEVTDDEWKPMFHDATWKGEPVVWCAFVNSDGTPAKRVYFELPARGS